MFLFKMFLNSIFYFLGILEEAEFYNITDLIRLVKERIKEKHVKMSKVNWEIHYFTVMFKCIVLWLYLNLLLLRIHKILI